MPTNDDKRDDGLLRVVDLGERAILTLLFASLVVRLMKTSDPSLYIYILVIAEGVTVALILCRRYTNKVTLRPMDWAVAFGGTMLPLMVARGGPPLIPELLGSGLMFLGLSMSLGAKLTLLRSFGVAAANRGVKVGGLYRLVRHPMYLSYSIIHVGFLLLNPSWRNLAIYVGVYICQVLRIFAEERQLERDPIYRSYMGEVRYRLVPGLF